MRSYREAIEEAMRLHASGKSDVAEIMYDQLLAQMETPDPNVFFGLGTIYVQKQRYGIGTVLLRTGLSIYDKHPLPWCNLGVAYKHMGRDDLSLDAYKKAYAIDPEMPEVLAGLGGYYINRDEAKKAEFYSRLALDKGPDVAGAHMNLGVALLEQGRFEEAWPHYEWRWDSLDRIGDKRPYKAPRWTGEKVDVLSIHGEQGLGDEILFMSLFKKAKERANAIVVECATRLVPLFKESFGVNCYPDHESLIAAEGEPDAYIPMASLPLVLGLPDGTPFLKRPSVARTTERPVIGIAWRGGTARTNARDRTLKLSDLRPILDAVDATFVSIQYGGDDVDDEAHAAGIETGDRGFDPLNYRIGICDLVVSVCQTAVHVAGAMGIETWVLTPKKAAWRYSGVDMRPFYNSVKLFRQRTEGEWASVITEIAACLRQKYAARAA